MTPSRSIRYRLGVRLLGPWIQAEKVIAWQAHKEANRLDGMGSELERYWMGRCTALRRISEAGR